MTGHRDHHATIFVAPEAAVAIEAIRRSWDPDMAAAISAHVTVAYPREAPRVDLLVERAERAAARQPPFRLGLGALGCSGRPEDGVHVGVEDVEGGLRALREELLRPPFQARPIEPHVTLVHPRTSRRGREFWDSRAYRACEQTFVVRELAVTAFDGSRWVVVAAFGLGPGPVRVEPLAAPPVGCLGALIAESEAHGLRFVRRLADEWTGGANRFDRPGETLLVATIAGEVVGVCGLNVDPYAAEPGVGRVRHLYVLDRHRRRGVGRLLVTHILLAARGRFRRLRLRTGNAGAARLYEGLGFRLAGDLADCTHVMELPA